MSAYKLVPVEPTPEMLEAGVHTNYGETIYDTVKAIFGAMLAAAPEVEQHPDDDAVDRFAAAMKAKLNKNRQEGRGGWQSMKADQLSTLLHEHTRKCDPVDVANLAMMLHQNGQRIEQQPSPDVSELMEAFDAGRRAERADAAVMVAALRAMIEQAQRVSVCGNFSSAPVLRAIDALAAYRKQGGE